MGETKEVELTEAEQKVYGDRKPKGYHKVSMLGKGGAGIVWKCTKDSSTYAVKQMAKKWSKSWINELQV